MERMVGVGSPVLLIETHGSTAPAPFAGAVSAGLLDVIEQTELTARSFEDRQGVLTTMHLDQILFYELKDALRRFLNGGGRIALMGHLMRPFLDSLERFVPIEKPKRASFTLCELSDHPIFAGISRETLETRKGVAGFYGRGHVPPPPGAKGVTGLGPERFPIDWVWKRPEGGEIFLHAGNNLWGVCDKEATNQLLAERLVSWCAGAPDDVEQKELEG